MGADYVGDVDCYSGVLARVALAMGEQQISVGGVAMVRSADIVKRLKKLKRQIGLSAPARHKVILVLSIGLAALVGFAGLKLGYALDESGGETANIHGEVSADQKQVFEGKLEWDKDIPVQLQTGYVYDWTLVTTKSIRFERTVNEVMARFKMNVREGFEFRWRTDIEFFDGEGKILARQKQNNMTVQLLMDLSPVFEEEYEFVPFEWEALAKAERFRITIEPIGPVLDRLWRPIDPEETDLIQGRISDAEGKPISDALVRIGEKTYFSPIAEEIIVATDSEGRYRIKTVDWPYCVTVRYLYIDPEDGWERSQSILLGGTYEGAQTIDVQFGAFPAGDAELEVYVTDEEGAPINRFETYVSKFDDDLYRGRREIEPGEKEVLKYTLKKDIISVDGSYRLTNLPVDEYTLFGHSDEKNYEVMGVREKKSLQGGHINKATVVIPAYRTYYGKLVFDDGTPAVLPQFRSETNAYVLKHAYVRTLSTDIRTSKTNRNGTVGSDGVFEINLKGNEVEQLKTGNYALNIYVPSADKDGDYVESGTFPFEKLSRNRDTVEVLEVPRPRSTGSKVTTLVGQKLPELFMNNLDLSREQVEGKRILVCLFKSIWAEARYGMMVLAEQAEELEKEGVVIVGIHLGNRRETQTREWLIDNNIEFPCGLIEDDKTLYSGLTDLPRLILTDTNHVVVAEGFGVEKVREKIKDMNSEAEAPGGKRQVFEGELEWGKETAVDLQTGEVYDWKLVRTRSIRFERTSSGVLVDFRAEVRRGFVFHWRTGIEFLDSEGTVLARQTQENSAGQLELNMINVHSPVQEEALEFVPFEGEAVAGAERFRVFIEPIGPVLDSLWRSIDPEETDLIQGRVTDAAGKPIVDALVKLTERHFSGSAEEIIVMTDSQGRYRVKTVDWPYTLEAEYRYVDPTDGWGRMQSLILGDVYEGAQMIDVQFEAFPVGGAELEVQLTDEEGKPINGYEAFVDHFDEDLFRKNRIVGPGEQDILKYQLYKDINREDGTYRWKNLPGGRYSLGADVDEKLYDSHIVWEDVNLQEGQLNQVKVVAVFNHKYYGKVVFEDGAPAVLKPMGPFRKTYIMIHEGMENFYINEVGRVEADGVFEIRLRASQVERLETGQTHLSVYVPNPDEEGAIREVGEFPFRKLSRNRDAVEVVVVMRPESTRGEVLSLVGKVLPERLLEGAGLTRADVEGKRILLSMFKMNWTASRYGMRALAGEAEALRQKGVVTAGIHLGGAGGRLREWLRENGIGFPCGLMEDDKTLYSGDGDLPRLILTDADHVVVAEGFGVEDLEELIKK